MRGAIVAAVLALGWCAGAGADPGTRDDRAALFAYILKATLERTAFEPEKPADIGAALGAGESVTMAEFVRREMLLFRDEMISADTDEKLYYALTKISNTRWDSHIRGVTLVRGGIAPPSVEKARKTGSLQAPIRLRADYSDREAMFLFVSDFAKDFTRYSRHAPQVGDKVVAVNGRPVGEYVDQLRRYVGRSSHRALWWTLATNLTEWHPRHVSPSLYDGDRLTLELEARGGERYRAVMPYLKNESIDWAGHDDVLGNANDRREKVLADPQFMKQSLQGRISLARYEGFEHLFSRGAFDVYVSKAKKAFVLLGHGFNPGTIVSDLDALLAHARAEGALDYSIIYDLTRGGGGDFEEYTLQRLQSQPFKIMFGNLRISDITPALARDLRESAVAEIAASKKEGFVPAANAQSIAAPDNGTYLLDWLDNHLARAIREKQAYSSNVQFKNQFLPVSSDGFLYPAKEHFTGPMVLFTSPQSCSGADQFAAMVIENNLGLSVGMPEGGCSNTWEWEEVLKLPSSGKPVVQFAWTAGHSIGPAGRVTEGGSAIPRVLVPLTRDNHLEYYDILMGHALKYIDAQRAAGKREPTKFDRITHHALGTGESR
jgi:hypothetical protein